MATRELTEVTCDRCGAQLVFERNGGDLPEGWEEVNKKELCPTCSADYERWFKLGKGPRRVK